MSEKIKKRKRKKSVPKTIKNQGSKINNWLFWNHLNVAKGLREWVFDQKRTKKRARQNRSKTNFSWLFPPIIAVWYKNSYRLVKQSIRNTIWQSSGACVIWSAKRLTNFSPRWHTGSRFNAYLWLFSEKLDGHHSASFSCFSDWNFHWVNWDPKTQFARRANSHFRNRITRVLLKLKRKTLA